MKWNGVAIGVGAWVLVFLQTSSVRAQQFSGAFYAGDANGNGTIEPLDIARAQQYYAAGAADYSGVNPPFADVAELNGNGFVDPQDFQVLQYWYIGQFPARTGAPATITAAGSTTAIVLSGESAVVCVEVEDSASAGDMIATDRSGWGVNFRVDQTAGLCTTALIFGRNPWPGGDDEYGYYPKAFEYTDRMSPSGHGRACARVVIPAAGCDGLDTIVHTYVPDDAEALCNGLPAPCFGTIGRFPTKLPGPDFTLFNGDPCDRAPVGQITLPADDSYHSSRLVEWWYWTGHLRADDGRWFGFEQSFFTAKNGGFPAFRFIMVHSAISDIQAGEFHYWTSDLNSGSFPYVANGFNLAISPQSAAGGNGHDVLHEEVDNYVLDLDLNSVTAPVLQLGDGYEYFTPLSIYTYYYSRERMEGTGTLAIDGDTLEVTASVWFDHQYGSHHDSLYDWDWFGVQFDDDGAVMLSTLHSSGGPIIFGTYTDANCISTELGPDDITITATGSWTSPHSGGVYPMGWDVTIGNIGRGETKRELNFTVTPVMEDQELLISGLSTYYWEGAAAVSGDVGGRAYVEMTGYAPGGCSLSPRPFPSKVSLANWIFLLAGPMMVTIWLRGRERKLSGARFIQLSAKCRRLIPDGTCG